MIFARDGDAYVPTTHAVGPWDPQALHGGAPSALLAREVERLAPEMQLARLTVEFLGAVPLEPLTVEAALARPGKRLQLAEATLRAGGRDALRARAVLLRRDALDDLPHGAPALPLPIAPDVARPIAFDAHPGDEGFGLTGMEIRFAKGSFGDTGPAQAWFRLAMPLVDDEEPTPAQRAVAAADFGNGISRELDWQRWLFINTDLAVHLHRLPRGAWIGLDAQSVLEPAGVGLATSTLHDEDGPIGRALQTLFVGRR